MELICIGKPALNIYLPTEVYPQEGETFDLNAKNESLGNVAATSACMMAKYGLKPYITGVVGNDAAAEKLRNTFQEYKVNTKFVEIDYEVKTASNYILLNTKNGLSTRICFNDKKHELTKYKYDFIPTHAIIDGTDWSGATALLNNYGNKVTSVFYARTTLNDTLSVAKRCTWIVCTQEFAEAITKYVPEEDTADYVNLYQKLVDVGGNSNFIVILKDRKILYCEQGKVKMLPEMKINVADATSFDSMFVGGFTYGLIKGLSLDDSIKFGNTAGSISLSRLGEEPAIPTLQEVIDNSGLVDKINAAAQKAEAASTPEATPEAPTQDVNTAQTPSEDTVTAFGSAPVENAQEASTPEVPTQTETSTPSVEQAPSETPAQPETSVTPVVPVETPKPAEPVPMPEDHTSNIFDNPSV